MGAKGDFIPEGGECGAIGEPLAWAECTPEPQRAESKANGHERGQHTTQERGSDEGVISQCELFPIRLR